MTSEDAADTALTGKGRVLVIAVLDEVHLSGETQEWISEISGLPGDSVRPRLRELAKMGFVEQTTRTRKTKHGKDARVWIITDAGRRAFRAYVERESAT